MFFIVHRHDPLGKTLCDRIDCIQLSFERSEGFFTPTCNPNVTVGLVMHVGVIVAFVSVCAFIFLTSLTLCFVTHPLLNGFDAFSCDSVVPVGRRNTYCDISEDREREREREKEREKKPVRGGNPCWTMNRNGTNKLTKDGIAIVHTHISLYSRT